MGLDTSFNHMRPVRFARFASFVVKSSFSVVEVYITSSSTSWLWIYPTFYEPIYITLIILLLATGYQTNTSTKPCLCTSSFTSTVLHSSHRHDINRAYRDLEGSCQCGGVEFTLQSQTPVPYQLCACSICRKVGGYLGAVNLGGIANSLNIIKGKDLIKYDPSIPTHFHFWAQDPPGNCHFIHRNEKNYNCYPHILTSWLGNTLP